MSKAINLDREVASCSECEVYKECSSKQMYTHKCYREAMRKNFDAIYKDDTEEEDDL